MTIALDLGAGRPAPGLAAPSAASGPSATASGVGRVRRLWIVPAAVVMVAAFALLPRVGDVGPGPGEARVRVDGVAEVEWAEGSTSTVTDGTVALGPGDLLEVVEGEAGFELADDVTFAGRAGGAAGDRQGTTVLMGLAPELVAGPLLVQAPTPVTVSAGGSEVVVGPDGTGAGTARVSQGLGLSLASYGGAVELGSAGRRVALTPLRRVEVPARGAPGRADLAVRYSADDPWDQMVLGDALAIDAQLGPLLAGLAARPGPDLRDPALLRRALPGLPASAGLAGLVEDASTGGDALVLAAMAAGGDRSTFDDRAAAAARFRSLGAEWGLVAMDQGVAPAELLSRVRSAVDRLASAPDADGAGPGGSASGEGTGGPSSGGVAQAQGGAPGAAGASDRGAATSGALGEDPSGASPGSAAGGAAAAGPGPSSGGGSTGGSGGSTGGGSVGGGSGGAADPGGAVGGVVGGVTDGVGGVVGGVTDGVGGVVGGVTDGVGGAVGEVGGAVGGVGAGGPLGGATGGVGDAVSGVGGAVAGLGRGAAEEADGLGRAAAEVVDGLGAAADGAVATTGGAAGQAVDGVGAVTDAVVAQTGGGVAAALGVAGSPSR